jgi:hypothetical protein
MEPIIIGAITLIALGFGLLLHHHSAHAMDKPDEGASHASDVERCASSVGVFEPTHVANIGACIQVCLTTCILVCILHGFFYQAFILCKVGLVIAGVYAVWVYDGSFLDDISNHATWVLVLWSNAVLLVLVRDTR